VSELPVNQLKIFLLAVMGGLRRNEIDKLEWPALRWEEGVIRIEATRNFQPKSEDSTGDVEIDPEVMTIFRGFSAKAKGSFVIESPNAPRPQATYAHYRCQRDFEALTKWLREHGVTGNTPLHTLRKEYGSQMCAKHGIYAASHALRHADIQITSQHYLDRKRRATVGMGHLLAEGANIRPVHNPKAGELVTGALRKLGGDTITS
jgi:integrase